MSHVDQLRVKAAPSVARRPNITVQEDQQFSPNPAQVPVEIPEAKEGAVVTPDYHGTPVLAQPALVVGRELEMMNIFLVGWNGGVWFVVSMCLQTRSNQGIRASKPL